MPCPMCLEKRADRFVSDPAEIKAMFGRRLAGVNELDCPACAARWFVHRSGPDHVFLYLAAGTPPSIEGAWAYSVSAPQGEGDFHRVLLTLRRDGETLTGSLAEWGGNDFDRDARSGRRSEVHGEWLGEHAWLTLRGGKTQLDGTSTALFFAKPFARAAADGGRDEQLLVARHEEPLVRNEALITWRRASPQDAAPAWLG